jgi:SprA-related family
MINNIDSLHPMISRSVGVTSQRAEMTRTEEQHGARSADTVQISKEGRDQLKASKKQSSPNLAAEELSPEQKQEVEKLKKRDLEVKAHEKAHESAGAGIVQGGATYQYQRGSDGRMYAVGGEVKIDTSRERDPENTIRKMQQVKKAALSPSQPSSQDRSVAAQASQIEAEARAELTKEKVEETNSVREDSPMAVSAQFSETSDPPQTASGIGRRINTVV